ncbi:iron ABC transporter permease [Conexibacter sp. SYSU D00693]|uniref:FecCD family ABC transporter permease n=1 Tax=Conexibacter sp. SYSU D00693 TaxID=2812560 RepID=UPI00196B8C55|nr:iron ABC transporter permease [Conexibacter sp. SYSU D00693]
MALRQTSVVLVALVALAAGAAASMTLGAVHVPLRDVVDAVTGSAEDGPLKEIVLQLRLPRTVCAIVVGAALGVAGALLQGALANPLASPDVIGVTGGAGFGAMLILLVFPDSIALLPVGALTFGLLAAGLVLAVAWTGPNGGGIGRLILAGIAISSLFAAATTSLMAAYADRVSSAIFFLAGGLTTEGWAGMDVAWPYFLVGFVLAALLVRPLDRLALGDDVAESLGARPRMIRLGAGAAAALLASSAAALAGLLGFLGLLVPHLVRLAGGTASHGYVVGASAVCGAALLLVGDTLARTVVAPVELPVGPLMVILGVPLFLWLLRKAT